MRVLIALALLTLSAAAHAQGDERVTILDYGILSGTTGKTVQTPGTAMGITREVKNFGLVRQTGTITAKLGERFGIHYRVDGVPRGKIIKAKCITRFPPGGVKTPKGETVRMEEYDCDLQGDSADWRSYTFDDPWELAPGQWSLEFWYRGQKIGEQRFTVVLP